MTNETIILLTYYYHQELYHHRSLKYIKKSLGAYLPFDFYLYQPLQKIFARVILYDYLERVVEIGIKAVNEEVITLVSKERPKYVLWTSWQYDILPSTLDSIRSRGSIVVGWFFDDEWRFDSYSKWWGPYLDYCVTNAMEAVPKYEEIGAKAIHTVPNTGITMERDWSKITERYDVSFIGSRFYADREQWISELNHRNIPVHLLGEGWGGYVSFAEMLNIFQSSKINLSFSGTVQGPKRQLKGRMFQVCLAGGFLLTEYAPGLEQYFEFDKEIACFQTKEEMVDKIHYYLNHDAERRAIAQAGWQRATSEYTSGHMVAKVFNQIKADVARRGKETKGLVPQLRMPGQVRKRLSIYYFLWGRTFLEDNRQGLGKEALMLSMGSNRYNIRAWYYYMAGLAPVFLRPFLFRLYAIMEKLYGRYLQR